MTSSDGWCTVFSAGLDSLGGQERAPFSPEIPQMAKMAQNHLKKGGTPIFCTVFILYLYNFFTGADRSPKIVFFYPYVRTGLKKHHFGACGGSPKKL